MLARLVCWWRGRHGSTETVTIYENRRAVARVWRCLDCGKKDWTLPGRA